MALLINIERWRTTLSKGFLRDIEDEKTHPHKRMLCRLLAAYFGPTTDEEKKLIEYTIRNNFGYTHRDSPYKYKGTEGDDNAEGQDSVGSDSAIPSDIIGLAREAEKRFPQVFGGKTDGSTVGTS
jgi:hypothetical protein